MIRVARFSHPNWLDPFPQDKWVHTETRVVNVKRYYHKSQSSFRHFIVVTLNLSVISCTYSNFESGDTCSVQRKPSENKEMMIRAPYQYNHLSNSVLPLKTLTKGAFGECGLTHPKKPSVHRAFCRNFTWTSRDYRQDPLLFGIHLSLPWLAVHNKHLTVDFLLSTVETVKKESEMPRLESVKLWDKVVGGNHR